MPIVDCLKPFNQFDRHYYFIARLMGTHVVILDEPEQESFETELVKDVITLMTVFCARLYGKRSWKNKVKENTGIKKLSFR